MEPGKTETSIYTCIHMEFTCENHFFMLLNNSLIERSHIPYDSPIKGCNSVAFDRLRSMCGSPMTVSWSQLSPSTLGSRDLTQVVRTKHPSIRSIYFRGNVWIRVGWSGEERGKDVGNR